jgi:hypothetical protein
VATSLPARLDFVSLILFTVRGEALDWEAGGSPVNQTTVE